MAALADSTLYNMNFSYSHCIGCFSVITNKGCCCCSYERYKGYINWTIKPTWSWSFCEFVLWSAPSWLHSVIGGALHRYHRGPGFKSRPSPSISCFSFVTASLHRSPLFAFAGLRVRKKRPLPWIETHFDPTAVHHLGRLYACPMICFADCDLSPLCLVHSFTIIPLLWSEPALHVKYHLRIRSLNNRRACSYIEFQPMAEVSFTVLVSAADAKEERPLPALNVTA